MNKIDEKAAQISDQLKNELGAIELDVVSNTTLADVMRLGAQHTKQSYNWGDGYETACALTAATLAGKSLGFIK